MKKSTLYNLAFYETVKKWEKEIKERDEDGLFKDNENNKKLFFAVLNEKQRELAQRYCITLMDSFDYTLYLVCAKLMNLSIKIGMEINNVQND